ncbi:maleylpyruvate isomerase N-terminal domain-containing protein [Amycolatopsis sp. Hca4]|uniref:maleylpyruvate isomerase N-terminal domain-containing protein n=1 Tax=Amycolatopsis sp. Hca4 TaxID=2742131 RepID=UPI00159230AB|nr:maleylpyruvate isomerase N-terminal domain-containing protein [Amycolatopsis sp. Hca4]
MWRTASNCRCTCCWTSDPGRLGLGPRRGPRHRRSRRCDCCPANSRRLNRGGAPIPPHAGRLTDEQVLAPSPLLSGWTRGHVLAHVTDAGRALGELGRAGPARRARPADARPRRHHRSDRGVDRRGVPAQPCSGTPPAWKTPGPGLRLGPARRLPRRQAAARSSPLAHGPDPRREPRHRRGRRVRLLPSK